MSRRKVTNRGFRIYSEQKDSHGIPFRVQASSAALLRAIWLFVEDPDFRKPIASGGSIGPALHLSETNAKRLIVALQKFVDGE